MRREKASPKRQPRHTQTHTLSGPASQSGQLHHPCYQETKRQRRREINRRLPAPPLQNPLARSPQTPGEGPGAAHLPARRQRAAGGGGQLPSPGRPAAGERPAANPGGAPGRREPTAGRPRRPPPSPPRGGPGGEEHHLGPEALGRLAARQRPRRARSAPGPQGLRAPLAFASRLGSPRLAARPPPARRPADSSAALSARAAGAGAPVTPEEGGSEGGKGGTAGRGRGVGRAAGRGRGSRSRWHGRAEASAQPAGLGGRVVAVGGGWRVEAGASLSRGGRERPGQPPLN